MVGYKVGQKVLLLDGTLLNIEDVREGMSLQTIVLPNDDNVQEAKYWSSKEINGLEFTSSEVNKVSTENQDYITINELSLRDKEILVIEPTKYAPSNPSSWKELYKYIQLAAFQNGISLGVNKGGKSLGYYNVQCKRGRIAQCSVRAKISEAKGSDNVSDYAREKFYRRRKLDEKRKGVKQARICAQQVSP